MQARGTLAQTRECIRYRLNLAELHVRIDQTLQRRNVAWIDFQRPLPRLHVLADFFQVITGQFVEQIPVLDHPLNVIWIGTEGFGEMFLGKLVCLGVFLGARSLKLLVSALPQ